LGRANELQLLINQEARATTGCFRTTNLGALSMESGVRAATAQQENRQRPFWLQLLSLPQGDQAREIVGALTAIRRRLTNALAYAGRNERTVLLEEPETLDAELLQEEAEAKAGQKRIDRDSLCSPTDHGSTVVQQGTRWCGGGASPGWVDIKTHMGYNQEATTQSALPL